MEISEGLKIIGEVEVFWKHPDGREDVVARRRNTILNSGMDLVAKALAGESLVNGMYFAYDNGWSTSTQHHTTPPVTRTAAFYHDDGGSPLTGTLNFIRVATLARPAYEATSAEFNGNRTVFVAVTSGAGVLSGTSNVLTDGTSDFYGAALAWLHPTDYQQDVLFSAVAFDDSGPATFEKVAGAQLGLRWGIHFTL
jgi:hypothetical protein